MRERISFGITILIIIHVVIILAELYFVFVLGDLSVEESSFYIGIRVVGFIMMICTLYFLVKPNVFGWKFILFDTILFTIYDSIQILYFEKTEDLFFNERELWQCLLINFGISLLSSVIYFWYIYKKKSYFYGVLESESSRGDVLDDESW